MQAFPHRYPASGIGFPEGNVTVSSTGVSNITTAPPAEFGGPGDEWSPEGLLVASVADCFIMTFRAIARTSKLDWRELHCDVVGVLDKVDGVTQFVEFEINAILDVSSETNVDKANKLLHSAEKHCLITNSLTGVKHLEVTIRQPEMVDV